MHETQHSKLEARFSQYSPYSELRLLYVSRNPFSRYSVLFRKKDLQWKLKNLVVKKPPNRCGRSTVIAS